MVTIDYIEVTNIIGLPANYTYDCSPSNCQFPGGSSSCLSIYSLVNPTSSDIGSYSFVWDNLAYVYAGAQKNIGPAGTTLVVIKKSLLDNICREVPSMLNYKIHNDKDSMFNTPPVFAVYACMLSMEWLKHNGGITEIEKLNRFSNI
mgnify:CR=1 FL=1